MKRNVLILVVAVLLIGIAVVTNASKEELPQDVAPKVGFLAPNFKLATLDGGEYVFDHAKLERPVLINFWASWCGPCQSEAPALAELHEKYKGKVDFVAVNATSAEFYGTDKVSEFVEKYNLKMPIPLDYEGKSLQAYNVIGFPLTVLIDQNGVIKHMMNYEFNPEDLDRKLAAL